MNLYIQVFFFFNGSPLKSESMENLGWWGLEDDGENADGDVDIDVDGYGDVDDVDEASRTMVMMGSFDSVPLNNQHWSAKCQSSYQW